MRRKKIPAVPVNTEVLPALSVANVRELLRARMPLKHLTEEQTIERIIEHLLNRTRSRKRRIKKQRLSLHASGEIAPEQYHHPLPIIHVGRGDHR